MIRRPVKKAGRFYIFIQNHLYMSIFKSLNFLKQKFQQSFKNFRFLELEVFGGQASATKMLPKKFPVSKALRGVERGGCYQIEKIGYQRLSPGDWNRCGAALPASQFFG